MPTLKDVMRTFYGENYLIWNIFVNYARETKEEKQNIFLSFVLSTIKAVICSHLSSRPPLPLLAC